jgi:hypothetical protein
MNAKETTRAAEIIRQINDLRNDIVTGFLKIETKKDWQFGSGVEPYRMEMVHATHSAKEAAEAVMISVARRQINILTDILRRMGVSPDPEDAQEKRI